MNDCGRFLKGTGEISRHINQEIKVELKQTNKNVLVIIILIT